jgi:uncharacterized protein YbbK (DUF523 family)
VSNVIIVSACLLGLPTRYDGRPSANEEVLAAIRSHIVVPVCPEQLGGLPTPRPAHFLDQGTGEDVLAGRSRVINDDGEDVTEEFLRGSRAVLRIAELVGAREAWLKEESPSCGFQMTSHGDEKVPGPGVATELLRSRGIRVRGFD